MRDPVFFCFVFFLFLFIYFLSLCKSASPPSPNTPVESLHVGTGLDSVGEC